MTVIRWIAPAAIASMLVATAAAHAADPVDLDWTCGQHIPLTKNLARAIVKDDAVEGGYAGKHPFLIAQTSVDSGGVILLTKRANRWRAYAVESGGGRQGGGYNAKSGDAVLFSMLSREGPGQSYTVLTTRNAFATMSCATIAFPEEFNQPTYAMEFLNFVDFNMEASGNGALIGSADLERDGKWLTRAYRYTTRDGGRSWSRPETLDTPPGKIAGILSPFPAAPKPLLQDFKRAMKIR